MAYSDYNFAKIEDTFGIQNKKVAFFNQIQPLLPSDWLLDFLSKSQKLPIKSEKARSEMIVVPILMELRNRNDDYFTIYSGENLNVDRHLKGECDFILSKDTQTFDVNHPIIQVVEAKKQDFDLGIPQCAAQMIGAKKFNEKRGNVASDVVYGCVTTGDDWLFMRLKDNVEIDTQKYYLGNLSELLGVFQHIIDYFKTQDKLLEDNN